MQCGSEPGTAKGMAEMLTQVGYMKGGCLLGEKNKALQDFFTTGPGCCHGLLMREKDREREREREREHQAAKVQRCSLPTRRWNGASQHKKTHPGAS